LWGSGPADPHGNDAYVGQLNRGVAGQGPVDESRNLEDDALPHRKPMQLAQHRRYYNHIAWCRSRAWRQRSELTAGNEALPCLALSWGQPSWQGLGFSGLVHEETHPCGSNFVQSIFKTVQAGCINSVLVQTVCTEDCLHWLLFILKLYT